VTPNFWVVRSSCGECSFAPLRHRIGSDEPQRWSRDEVTLMIERVVDSGVSAEKELRRSGRFEALYLAFASSHHLV
jgi:hypothetical protein